MDLATLKELVSLGAPGLVVVVLFMNWKREERSAQAFADLNKSVQERDTKVISELTRLSTLIDNRPCVKNEERN